MTDPVVPGNTPPVQPPAPAAVPPPAADPKVAAPTDPKTTPPVDPKAAAPDPKAPPADPTKVDTLLGGEPAAPPADPPVAKPEDYKLKFPDGITNDDPYVQTFLAAAAKQGMPNGMAQQMFDAVAPQVQAALRAPYEEWGRQQKAWQDEVRADPEIGGAALEANVGRVSEMLDHYARGIDWKSMMLATGAGNNPTLLKLLHRIAEATWKKPDAVRGNPPKDQGQPGRSAAEKLYPNTMGAPRATPRTS